MGFALPWALVGLVAVGVPLVAHLMRRHKLPRQTLPTIAFLRRVYASRTARFRIVDLLLLALRIALVVLLVLAAARPYRVVSSTLGDRQQALAIVLDDSMSMSAIRGGSTRIERAVALARSHVAKLAPGSEVSVVLAGKPARLRARQQRELDTIAEALADLDPSSSRAGDLCGAVSLATEVLQESDLNDRRLLVLSDFAPGTRAAECEWPRGDLSLAFEPIGAAERDNLRIGRVDVSREQGGSTEVTLDVTVEGAPAQDKARVVLRHKGQESDQAGVEWVDGQGRATVTVPSDVSPNSVVELRLRPDDALPEDNVKGVPLRSETIHVLLVDGDPHPDPRKRETTFIRHALEVAPQAARSFAVEVLDAQDLSETAIMRADVVVLANASLDTGWSALLRRFVSAGGGLWITAGDRVEARAYAGVLGDLLPARYTATRNEERSLSLASDTLPELEQASVRRRTPLEVTSLNANVLARFNDGSPALVEHRYRSGRVALLATTVDDAWTDLPYQPAFPAFVYSVLERLAARSPDRIEPFGSVILPGSTDTQRMQVVLPSGSTVDLPEGDRITFRRTGEVGAYRVLINGIEGERFSFVVDAPAEESDLEAGEPPEIESEPATGAGQAELQDERPIAPWLLLAAAFLLLLEVWMRQTRRS